MRHFVNLRKKGEWILRSWQSLMILCWQNRYEDLSTIKTPYFIVCLSQNTSQMILSLMPKSLLVVCMEKHFESKKSNIHGCKMENRGWFVHKGI